MTKNLSPDHLERKLLAEGSLEEFIKLVHPKRCLGNIHRQVIQWWEREDAKDHQLLLLPRDHMKSALIAYRVVQALTVNPASRILFISSTSNLATKQLKFIKDILTCDTYRTYWPDMVEREEAKREKWTEREISVDHPLRREEAIRDPSIFTAGLTSNIVGMHCDIAVLDDVVVADNAYTEEGRDKVKSQYSLLSSIEAVNAREWVVGTRYHPKDLYSDLINMEIEEFDDTGSVEKVLPLFERGVEFGIAEEVESIGDGSGEFLWPRQNRGDGQWFGFNQEVLSKKRAQYLDKTQFRAQYYNDPHDVGSSVFKRDLFQHYDQGFLSQRDGKWYFKGERLNVVAAVDFAFTTGRRSDFSCIVVLGLDGRGNYFVLEIDRFKTEKISDQFEHLLKLHNKWGFRKIRAEVTAAQKTIVTDLKESYIRPLGLSLSIDEYRPSRWQGAKEERIMAALQPKYENHQIWHYLGGNCQVLEEELLFVNPAHDDVKDALASAVDFSAGQAPLNVFNIMKAAIPTLNFHNKFGGVS